MSDSLSEEGQATSVTRQYDAWARVYDLLWRRYVNKTVPVAQRAAQVAPGERVLDLGCGTGELGRRIVETVPDVRLTGVDLSEAMIDRARRKLSGVDGVRFEQADAHDLPFEGSSFDVVVCANTFHYFPRPSVVLDEVARVLDPEGRFVVLDWCRDFWTCRGMDVLLQWIDPAHHRCYTLDEMSRILEAASFKVRDRFRYRFDLVWGMMVLENARSGAL